MCNLRDHRPSFLNYDVFLPLTVHLIISISVDPDEIQHYAAFYLGLHCLPKNLFRSFKFTKVNSFVCFVALRPKSTAKVMAGRSKG